MNESTFNLGVGLILASLLVYLLQVALFGRGSARSSSCSPCRWG